MTRLSRGVTSGIGAGSRHGSMASMGGLDRAQTSAKSFEDLKRLIHSKLVDKLDLSKVSDPLKFGGPPECPTRPLCIGGLKSTYVLKFNV